MEERPGFLPCGTRCALPKTVKSAPKVGQELGHHIGAAVCRHALEAQKGRGGVALSEVARILLIVLSAAVVALLVHRVAEAKMEVHLVKAVAADGIGTD